jgi:acetyl esterase/lipase
MFDPAIFLPSSVSAETAQANAAIAEMVDGTPWPPASVEAYRATVEETIARLSGGAVYHSPRATDRTVTDRDGSLRLRVLANDAPTGIYLYLHGGGWTIGSADQQDAVLEELVTATGMAAVSVDYRLAPEHPFPAALDDAERAARWLLKHGADELGSDKFTIGGESSGANLALGTLLRLRATGDQARFRSANLLYGWYDASLTPSVHGPFATGGVLTAAMLEWFADQYLPSPLDRRSPEASPLRADLRGLPPTLLTVGTQDPLLDDSLFLHARLLAAGVASELQVAPGGGHAFDFAPIAISRDAKDHIATFLSASIAG